MQWRLKALAVLAFGVLASALVLWLGNNSQVSTALQVQQLPENLRRTTQARIDGVVTFADPIYNILIVRDATGGIRIRPEPGSVWPSISSRVAVTGVVGSGGLNPEVIASSVSTIAKATLPAAVPISFKQARSGRFEYRRIAVEGVIRSVHILERSGRLALSLSNGPTRIKLRVVEYANRDFRSLVDAKVRVDGVLSSSMDVYGNPSTSTIWVSDLRDITVLEATSKPANLPLRSVASLSSASVLPLHRVRLRGLLSGYENGHTVLRDGSGTIAVPGSPLPSADGKEVDLAGFAEREGSHLALRESILVDLPGNAGKAPRNGIIPAIKTAAAIHNLSPSAADIGYPVHLQGVVTYFRPRSQLLFLQDSSAGIFVSAQGRKLPPVKSGDLITIDGATAMGGFAPVIAKAEIAVLGKNNFPQPARADQEEVFGGALDSQWVELPGVVRSAVYEDGETVLNLSLGQHLFRARVEGPSRDLSHIVDSFVRIRGVAGALTNERRQILGIQLFVPGWSAIQVQEPSHTDPFRLPVRRIASIMQFSLDGSLEHRVHLRGRVLLSSISGPTWISDESGGLMITSHDPIDLKPGDRVEAVGFQSKGPFAPRLDAAVIHRLGPGASPDPIFEVPDEVIDSGRDSQYLQVDARLLNISTVAEETVLLLQSGKTTFYAHIRTRGAAPVWDVGSILRVRGVCAIEVNDASGVVIPQVFRLNSASVSEVSVLKHAPWFSKERAAWWLFGTGFALLLFAVWVASLQKRVRQQTQTINRKLREEANLKGEAQKANDAKTQFLANMSHEIRTPLNGIIGFTDLTLGTPLSAEQSENLSAVKNSAASLLSIVNDILDFSKVEAGMMDLNKHSFTVRNSLRAALKTIQPITGRSGVLTSCFIEDSVPQTLNGDENRLRQVVLNLLSNAAKFTAQGEIRLTARAKQRVANDLVLEISVSDTGIGIAKQSQERIFDAFHQADGSITRNYGGTGLGLAICKRIVDLLGGEIQLDSEPGVGTTIRFTGNFGVVNETAPAAPAGGRPPKTVPGSLRILVAEDNAVNRKLIERVLQREGHSVSLAVNGVEAVNRFIAEPFDLILMDVHMPEMDGLQATRTIRELPAGVEIPILAFTASAMETELQKCLDAGMNGCITKPLILADLLLALAEHTRPKTVAR